MCFTSFFLSPEVEVESNLDLPLSVKFLLMGWWLELVLSRYGVYEYLHKLEMNAWIRDSVNSYLDQQVKIC